MIPFLAFAYNPLVSLASQFSNGVETYTSKKSSSPIISLAILRISRVGEMKAAMVMMPDFTRILATSAMRRMFSVRSSGEKPRSLFSPDLISSPSRTQGKRPLSNRAFSRARARVVLPEHGRPVSQMTRGRGGVWFMVL